MIARRALGRSGITVAPLVLGGNVFGWTADEATSFAILDAFIDAGGTMVDTADVYSSWVPGNSGGESETLIGRWLKRDPAKRAKVQIATKVGFAAGLAPETIASACDVSLQRLGIDAIDLYYQHTDDPKVPLADSLGAFDRLAQSGKIRAVGLSQFTPERVDEAMRLCAAGALLAPSALQCWYNLLERAKLEGPLRDTAVGHGLAILPFYGLANGFLAGKYRSADDLGKSPRGLRNIAYLEGRGPRVLAALDDVAAQTGAALATVALAWTIAQPGITAALASATSVGQLDQLIAAMTVELTPSQIEQLDTASG